MNKSYSRNMLKYWEGELEGILLLGRKQKMPKEHVDVSVEYILERIGYYAENFWDAYNNDLLQGEGK